MASSESPFLYRGLSLQDGLLKKIQLAGGLLVGVRFLTHKLMRKLSEFYLLQCGGRVNKAVCRDGIIEGRHECGYGVEALRHEIKRLHVPHIVVIRRDFVQCRAQQRLELFNRHAKLSKFGRDRVKNGNELRRLVHGGAFAKTIQCHLSDQLSL